MIGVVVLAAGTSSRFGRTKQLEEVRGSSLVQHAVDAAAEGGADDIVVVLGHEAPRVGDALRLPDNARTVTNPRYEQGQATSLNAGIAALAPDVDAAIVLVADQPGIRADHVRALVHGFADSGAEILRIRFRDGPGPALLARPTWPEIAEITGDTGARALMDATPGRVRWIAFDEPAPRDVDAPEDLGSA